ncbi:CHAT domain-containing protein [uncultured Phycicoccus sp.]|uniref:CHAT domain-containing protein n=1 Tax=uncultured Phycicoccus sp. TaxID=661422 RepID=UPI002620131C|nr:CHAT domain-containing protein [uncultured Phycicoccus sp.]
MLSGRTDHAAGWMRIRIVITRSWAELELRGVRPALAMLRAARQDADALGDPLLVALTHIQEGTIQGRVGAWRDCVDSLSRAAAHEDLLDPAQTWALRLNLGQGELGVGNIRAAAEHADAAAAVAARHGLVDLEFKARHNRAVVAFVAGDLPRALTLMRAADAMETAVSRDRSRLDEADVLLDAGLVDAARRALRIALDAAHREGHRIEEGEIALRLARCDLLVDDLEPARQHVRGAVAAYRTRQASELVREADLVRTTVDVAAGTDLPAVVATLAERNGAARTASPSDRAAIRLEAEARVLLGDVSGAQRCLSALDDTGTDSLAAGLHDALVRARVEAARGHRADTERHVTDGNRLLAAHQFLSSSLDVRAAMALHGRRLAEFDIAGVLRSGTPAEVATTVERWRAISHRINPVSASPDPGLAELTRELRRLRQLLVDSDGAVIRDITARVSELEPLIAQREWSLATDAAAGGAAPAVAADEGAAAARERATVVVEFFESGGRLHAVTLGAEPPSVHDVGDTAEVAALGTRLRRDLRARAALGPSSPMTPVLARATRASLDTVDAVLRPLWRGDGRVVVVPSGSLAAMPWSLLPSLRGRPVTVAPSVTRWVRGPARGGGPRASEALRAVHGPGLARSAAEVDAVRDAWAVGDGSATAEPAAVGLASSADVLEALACARVVHLAAHGIHEPQSPLFSSVRMSDGPVFAHEFPRPVAAEHVALAACDVGQFSSRPGAEPLGLAVALLSLGATSVLAAVSPVADDLAAEAMVGYHRLLAQGADAAQAWAEVVELHPDAGVFCLYGSDWSCLHGSDGSSLHGSDGSSLHGSDGSSLHGSDGSPAGR